MPSLLRPRVLSLNFFNRSENDSPTSSNSIAALKNVNSASSSSRDLPATQPASPIVRDTAPADNIPRTRASTIGSRPASQMYPYNPPLIGAGPAENIEELLPVFSFLSSHSNKLYQEGYFLKLNDLDTSGKPNADRTWTECFAQLVGTVLSLWDAAALDAAGQDGEVPPTFINLADASIKMIETLPTRNQNVQPLQNVLSISTAGKNRYLLHFNSIHSLTQWTAGIRLSMFEHATLQELYTGSLIAGKGKHLNNIKTIMERSRFISEDWARVRFGAGTPWRRCWCVIEPPSEKEYARANKTSLKKRSAYERPSIPKGDIKFYDTKKTKKAVPIATITDAYSAYAIYPQSKPLIDQSTLVKVEGKITIHSTPESKTEGFVFVMPELHPAVSGFEMMLRWLFPVYDVFNLYGRPTRLIADILDPRGLMFAMPTDRRYGYIDIIDVAGLIHTEGSERWSEREWRKQLKDITSRRMQTNATQRNSNIFPSNLRQSSESRTGVHYGDNASVRSQPGNQSTDAVFATPNRADTAPPGGPFPMSSLHNRSVSENVTARSPNKSRRQNEPYRPSRMSEEQDPNDQAQLQAPLIPAPAPPINNQQYRRTNGRQNGFEHMDSRNSSDSELQGQHTNPEELNRDVGELAPPTPVIAPPTMQHETGDRPRTRPSERPDLRREKSRMSNATLAQMTEVNKMNSNGNAAAGATAAWKAKEGMANGDSTPRGVMQTPIDAARSPANQSILDAAMVVGSPEDLRRPRRADSGSRASSRHSVARKPLPASRHASEHSATRTSIHRQEVPPISSHNLTTIKPIDMYSSNLAPEGAVLPKDRSPDRNSQQKPNFRDTASTELRSKASRDLTNSRKSEDARARPQAERPRAQSRSASYNPNYRLSTAGQATTVIGPSRSDPASNGLTAEEDVQQRAVVARLPSGYATRRNQSSSDVERRLSGAMIDAREQEKRNLREGVPGPMVEAAIAQRQVHERQQIYGPQSQAQYAAQTAYAGRRNQQQQQFYGSPQAQPQQPYYAGQVHALLGQGPPGQFVHQVQGYGAQSTTQSQWQPPQQPHQQQRYAGCYAPNSGQQDPYR